MWLPRPIYESLPWAYWVIGLLMLVLTAYVGDMRPVTIVYMSTGALSFAAGIVVASKRAQARKTGNNEKMAE